MTAQRILPRTALLASFLLAGLGAISLQAQIVPPTQITPSNDTGTNPFGSYSTDAGNINLSNGNLNLNIPLVSLPGRNGHDFVLSLQYDSKIWTPSAAYSNTGEDITYTWKAEKRNPPIGSFGWRLSLPAIDPGSLDYDQFGTLVGLDGNTLTLPDGSKHYLSARGPFMDAEDGSSLTMDNSSGAVHQKDGSIIFGGTTPSGASKLSEDTNGNYISATYNAGLPAAIFDSLGRQVTLTYLSGFPYTLLGSISYKDSNGTTQTITLNYSTLPLFSTTPGQYFTPTPPFANPVQNNCSLCHFHIWVRQPMQNSTSTMLTSIVLPDNTSYTFTYNGYGELTKVTYPTGSYTAYDYAAFTHRETYWEPGALNIRGDFREVTARRICRDPLGTCSPTGTPEDITTFTPTVDSTQPGNQKMDVISPKINASDPSGYKNHYEFSVVDSSIYARYSSSRETLHSIYSETGVLLRTTQTTYVNVPSFCICPAFPADVTTTLNDSPGTALVTKTHYDYDTFSATVMYPPYDPANGIDYFNQSLTNLTYAIDNPTQVLEYDYGSGAPGPLVRKTVNTWLKINAANGNVDYSAKTIHIWNRKSDTQVFDSGTSKFSEAQFEYDNYPVSDPITSSGAVQHDTIYNGPTNKTRGNLTAIKRWRNTDNTFLSTQFRYDDAGNATKAIDPLNHTTLMSYADVWANAACAPVGGNAATFLTSVTDALSHVTSATYNSCTGTMASITDQNGQITGFPIYDLMGRLIRTTLPDGGQMDRTYLTASAPFSVNTVKKLDASRSVGSQLYVDGLARVFKTLLCEDGTSCAQTIRTDTTYDPVGRTSTVSNPYRLTSDSTYGISTTKYDALNRTTKIIPPDGTTSANNVSTVYAGNCVTVTDQAGKTRKSCSDALGRLIQVFEPNSANALVNETDYQYDVLNNLLRVDQKGNDANAANWRTRLFTYNSLSQLLTSNNPESGTLTYTYNDDGTLVTKTSPAPNQTGAATVTTTYAYDALHRLTQKSFSDGTTPTVKYGYDAVTPIGCTLPTLTINNGIGKRTGMCDAAGAEAWSYDITLNVGWKITDARTTNGVTKTTIVQNNLAGSVATLTYPSGRTITYTPDAAGRTVSAVDSTGPINYATAATYAPQGALASVQNGSSLSSTYIFNSRLQPCWLYATTGTPLPATTLCTATAAAGNILDFKYDFSLGTADNGNVISITNNRDPNRTQNFTYDSMNRIATAFTSGNLWGETFQIDPWGNLNKILLLAGKPQPENLNQLAGPNNRFTGMSYDAPGNLLNDGASNYTYDAENRITTGAGVTYSYDGDGKRAKKSNGKLYWYGMGSDPLSETDLAGNSPVEYVFFGGKRIARRDPAGAIAYYFADHLGSSRVVTNSTGTILDDSDFYPFGGERTVLSSSGNTYKFTGKERDPESGLDDFGARYYSSSLGRFLSADWSAVPIPVPYANLANPQTLNLYAIVHDNPESFVDLDGHSSMDNEIHHQSDLDDFMKGRQSGPPAMQPDPPQQHPRHHRRSKPPNRKPGSRSARIVFNETSGLRPGNNNPEDLHDARVSIAHTILNAAGMRHRPRTVGDTLTTSAARAIGRDPDAMAAWADSQAAATEAGATADNTSGAIHFFLDYEGATRPAWATEDRETASYGPFTNAAGGGDVPEGAAVTIRVYTAQPQS